MSDTLEPTDGPEYKSVVKVISVSTRGGQVQLFLVVSLESRDDCQVVAINRTNGRLEAWRILQTMLLEEGKAILGYVVIGTYMALLLATKVWVQAVLPPNHKVCTVMESKWASWPMHPQVSTEAESFRDEALRAVRGDRSLEAYDVNNCHFFCETADITRPFPSEHPQSSPSWAFVWNSWLSKPFRQLPPGFGGDALCPPLLQGMARAAPQLDLMNQAYHIALISRRSRLHPGTRYIARGLNETSEPGNEIECDAMVWRKLVDNTWRWSRYTWRRGSVPIHWGMKFNGASAEIVIKERPLRGCKRYFRRLQKRYMPSPHLGREGTKDDPFLSISLPSGSNVSPSHKYPIYCISLLRKGMPDRLREPKETDLQSKFSDAVHALKRSGMAVEMYSLDWHDMEARMELPNLVSQFWAGTLNELHKSFGMAVGSLRPALSSEDSAQPRNSAWGRDWTACWQKQQKGVLRLNCADSLDRTNVACFYASVQVLVEQCQRVGLRVAAASALPDSLDGSNGSKTGLQKFVGGAKKFFGAARASSSTVYQRQGAASPGSGLVHAGSSPDLECLQALAPWSLLTASTVQFGTCVQRKLLQDWVDCFKISGDINGFIYTGAPAMHVGQLDLLMVRDPGGNHRGWASTFTNALVSVRRRWNNVISDPERTRVMELFLGQHIDRPRYHFRQPVPVPIRNDSLQVADYPDSEDNDLEEGMLSHSGLPLAAPRARSSSLSTAGSSSAAAAEAAAAASPRSGSGMEGFGNTSVLQARGPGQVAAEAPASPSPPLMSISSSDMGPPLVSISSSPLQGAAASMTEMKPSEPAPAAVPASASLIDFGEQPADQAGSFLDTGPVAGRMGGTAAGVDLLSGIGSLDPPSGTAPQLQPDAAEAALARVQVSGSREAHADCSASPQGAEVRATAPEGAAIGAAAQATGTAVMAAAAISPVPAQPMLFTHDPLADMPV